MPYTLPASSVEGTTFNLSGTSTTLSPIDSGAKRVTLAWGGMLTNVVAPAAGDFPTFYLGTTGGLVTTGYAGKSNALTAVLVLKGTEVNANIGGGNSGAMDGMLTIIELDSTNHIYLGTMYAATRGSVNLVGVTAASITLPAALSQIAVTTPNGTGSFTGGKVRMVVEG